ncbi:UDP-4-amino-4,6-dideoxy-N-acetyl-beta-L-altrosamine N-acetyltransferase [Sulfurimonas autotrophica]|uniref:Pseudaminic acid biosynthesis N-acetyl transferase n=1 Tax=Sulfurimonas autotrophica (strain ATCC BAA-671 / DSM 16294 / JCM 11897 / OK10) TaxID=563040 RepID=E0UT83_SULAO|nr:UDP-4-amino-4,6-dideoxy-N-acetyl-beta-L-altrosamine N-acetyltransferase [Sulfurimonas autotrophica]ADN08186.1 pseudaminic acid biosynthesis N-acetyl transferase [Sulfurimonas autotrophica DSM 16294]
MKINGATLINFIELNEDTQLKILTWRNHPTIKKWMYTDDNILLDNHLNFISSLKSTKDKQYFVVDKDEQQIGVIYFTNIDTNKKECEFGLYANPFEKIAGVGSILEKLCIEYAFDILKLKKLKLEVFSNNKKALNLYKKFNFKEIGKKIVNNKDVICMELKNENR